MIDRRVSSAKLFINAQLARLHIWTKLEAHFHILPVFGQVVFGYEFALVTISLFLEKNSPLSLSDIFISSLFLDKSSLVGIWLTWHYPFPCAQFSFSLSMIFLVPPCFWTCRLWLGNGGPCREIMGQLRKKYGGQRGILSHKFQTEIILGKGREKFASGKI